MKRCYFEPLTQARVIHSVFTRVGEIAYPRSMTMVEPAVPTVALAAVYGGLFLIALALTAIDAREHRLPNRIVIPTAIGVVVLCVVDTIWRRDIETLTRALLGGGVLMGGYFLLYRGPAVRVEAGGMSASGMGAGDVKLAFPLGVVLAWHGWVPLMIATVSAFLLAGATVTVSLVRGRAHAKSLIAFGPFMLMGAVLGVASTHETIAATIVGV